MSAFTPPIDVEHTVGPDGVRCVRCRAGLGAFVELQDDGNWLQRPWREGETVIEVEQIDRKSVV